MSSAPEHRWPRGIELAVLAVAMLACLLPFANKAYHIDDTLFVWAAQQIQQHPLDFFGFSVHWYETWMPMSDVTQNPPLTCYYLALAGSLFGWGEIGLHLAMLVPSWFLIWGTYRLAERFSVRPLPAALLTLFTPGFLVSASSVMCDIMMLALWVWTIVVWDRGLRERRRSLLLVGGALIALTSITKYFGICLIPLLGVYSYSVDRSGWRRCLPGLGIAFALLAAYQALFMALYFRGDWQRIGGLAGAMGYAASFGPGSPGAHVFRFFEGLAFIGGCVGVAAIVVIFLLQRGSKIIVGTLAVIVVPTSLLLSSVTTYDTGFQLPDSPFVVKDRLVDDSGAPLDVDAKLAPQSALLPQFVIWVAAGLAVLLLAVEDLRSRRDPVALLFFLWMVGTAIFAAFVNWALNSRSVLPLVPVASMLLVRRLDQRHAPNWALPAIIIPAAALSLLVTYADATMANANRTAAQFITEKFAPEGNRALWYQGHWGYQYYLHRDGGKPWDNEKSQARKGDFLALPANNYNNGGHESVAVEIEVLDVETCTFLATMSPFTGAGNYACVVYWRPLPFAFGPTPPERFGIYRLTSDQLPPAPKK